LERFLIVPRRLVPFFALLARANVPEELVNTASPELAFRFQRSRVNQPDPTFPQSPGIIFEISGVNFIRRSNMRGFKGCTLSPDSTSMWISTSNPVIPGDGGSIPGRMRS
jgi:hypothetical protein